MMDKIIKTIRYVELLEIYKSQLTHTQQEMLESYFQFDLSLSEIAENKNISRAAVEDALKKGIQKLESLEASLHILEKKEKILKIIANIKET